jgi:hypothetical protein
VSEKSGVMKENCWTVVLVVVHRVFLSSFYYFTHKVVCGSYHLFVHNNYNKLNSSMSNYGGREGQPKKMKLILGISFFCQHNSTGGGFLIFRQIVDNLNLIINNFNFYLV